MLPSDYELIEEIANIADIELTELPDGRYMRGNLIWNPIEFDCDYEEIRHIFFDFSVFAAGDFIGGGFYTPDGSHHIRSEASIDEEMREDRLDGHKDNSYNAQITRISRRVFLAAVINENVPTIDDLRKKEVYEVEYNQLRDWANRIHTATICMNDDIIKKVVKEIQSFYWLAEGERHEDKLIQLQMKQDRL